MKTLAKLVVILTSLSLTHCGSSSDLTRNRNGSKLDHFERILCEGAHSEISDGYGGGTGTKENPYLICAVKQFKSIQGVEEKRFFRLTTDLDFSTEGNLRIIAVSPLASIDGDNHKLKNITIEQGHGSKGNGLFGQLVKDLNGNPDEIKNLIIENIKVIGDGTDEAGGVIAGSNWGGIISNVRVTGEVQIHHQGNTPSAWSVGGLVGRNSSIIENSSFDGSVCGIDHVGGIAGINDGVIRNSTSSGQVRGRRAVGGIVGIQLKSGQILNIRSSATIEAKAVFGPLAGILCDSDDYEKCDSR